MVKVSWKDKVGSDMKNSSKGNVRLKRRDDYGESENQVRRRLQKPLDKCKSRSRE